MNTHPLLIFHICAGTLGLLSGAAAVSFLKGSRRHGIAVAAVDVTFGLEAAASQTGMKYGYPPGPYFFLGSVALLATIGDVRMLVRGGISGAQRIARHLWRMCFVLFIASSSLFLARPHLFPALMRKTGMLFLLSFLPLILMIYWLARVLLTKHAMGRERFGMATAAKDGGVRAELIA